MANIVGTLNLNECSDYSLFEMARDDVSSMKAIRLKQIEEEKNKHHPDESLIAQWEADVKMLFKKNNQMNDRAGNIRIIMEYSPQIRAWHENFNKAEVRAT